MIFILFSPLSKRRFKFHPWKPDMETVAGLLFYFSFLRPWEIVQGGNWFKTSPCLSTLGQTLLVLGGRMGAVGKRARRCNWFTITNKWRIISNFALALSATISCLQKWWVLFFNTYIFYFDVPFVFIQNVNKHRLTARNALLIISNLFRNYSVWTIIRKTL